MESKNLKEIDPKLIDFDLLNPRGETVEQITNDDDFYKLKNSIDKHGLFQPLIVKEQTNDSKRYLLIDGERRLRAILDLKKDKVLTNIVDNDVEGNIVAYQIHQNRKPWSKISETKSIERIIESIKTDTPNITDSELKRKLVEITSHKLQSITDMLKILKYSKEIRGLSENKELDHSYLIRIEDDFTQPLIKNFPQIVANKGGEDNIRNIMVEKAKLGLLKNTRYMMTSGFKEIFQGTESNTEVQNLISIFLDTKSQSAETLYQSFKDLRENNTQSNSFEDISTSQQTQNTDLQESITNEISTPITNDNFQTEVFTNSNTQISQNDNPIENEPKEVKQSNSNNIKGIKAKKSDYSKIKQKYELLYNHFSNEEKDYLVEAFECLVTEKCMKAATLMIWAATISRILTFIEKDISKFNVACTTMNQQKKSFYKHYAGNFQTTATDIEQIRELAKDMQLVCFLGYENIINSTEVKKLKANLDKRNDCAHPTSIKLSFTEVIVVFEQLHDIIFNNSKLK